MNTRRLQFRTVDLLQLRRAGKVGSVPVHWHTEPTLAAGRLPSKAACEHDSRAALATRFVGLLVGDVEEMHAHAIAEGLQEDERDAHYRACGEYRGTGQHRVVTCLTVGLVELIGRLAAAIVDR